MEGEATENRLGQITQQLETLVANPLHEVSRLCGSLLNPLPERAGSTSKHPEHTFESVATTTPVLMWVSDTTKAAIFFNKAWLNFTGRKLEDELGNGWMEGVHHDDVERVQTVYGTSFAHKQDFRLEYRLLRFDGQYRWVLDIATPRYIDGQFAGFSGSCVDITEIKESRAKLAAVSRQQHALVVLGQLALNCLNSTVFGSGLGAFAQSYDGEHFGLATLMLRAAATTAQTFDAQRVSILEFSAGSKGQPHFQYCEGYGWGSSELQYLDENPCCLPTYCARKSSRGDIMDFNLEVDVLYAYFEKLNVQTPLAEIIHGPGNKPYGILCVHFVGPKRFITPDEINTVRCISHILSSAIAQERAYHSLCQSEQITRSIIDSASSGILSVDSMGNIISMNPSACCSFGFEEKRPPIGIHISFLVPSFSSMPHYHAMPPVSDSNKAPFSDASSGVVNLSIPSFSDAIHNFLKKSTELTGVKKSGATFPLRVTVDEVPLHNETLFTIFMQDMTNAKQLEREAAASAQKSMFLSRMSHELRTPLNSVLNLSEILLDTEPLSLEQKDMIDSLITSGNNLRTLIDDILDLSKIEAGKMELACEPFGVRECVEHSLDVLAICAQQKNIELLLFVDETVPSYVVGDPSRLRQVFVNVIGNAIKFTESGNVRIHVSCDDRVSSSGSNECTLRFKIKDTGIGIEPMKIQSLFMDFTQVHAPRHGKYGGTGLGLAISKKIIELMHGTICVESSNRGTTVHFTVHLPVFDSQPPIITPVARISKSLSLKRSPRALIVHVDPEFREMIANMCNSLAMDCDFIGVESPAHALQFVTQGQHFDFAILEYHSKEGCSSCNINVDESCAVEFARQMGELGVKFPIVLITPIAFSKSSLGEHTKHFEAYIPKPIKLANFRKVMGQFICFGMRDFEDKKPSVIRDDGKVILQNRRASSFDRTMSLSIPLSILVAEDNPANQKVVVLLFSRLGYTVDIVEDGLEALKAVEQKHYDVLFMDVEMPNMDGIECSRVICSKYSEDARPVIVAQTAHVLREDIERCFQAGMKYCIIKPLKVDKIIEILKKVGSKKYVFGTPDRKLMMPT